MYCVEVLLGTLVVLDVVSGALRPWKLEASLGPTEVVVALDESIATGVMLTLRIPCAELLGKRKQSI
jgi:hypothetical protein